MNGNFREFKFVDLFCGAGGLSFGLEMAGLKCGLAIDEDDTALETHRRNLNGETRRETITLDTELLPTDLIVGGPPCQGFSSAGRRVNGDLRNSLVSVYANLVATAKPKAFLFENVEGFFTTEQGARVFDLLDPLIEAGYSIHLKKVNVANYGVAQNRKRIVAIGGLGGAPEFPLPLFRAHGTPGSSSVYKNLPFSPTLGDCLEGLPEPSQNPPGTPLGHYVKSISELDLRRIEALSPGERMSDLPRELRHESFDRRANRRVKDGTPTERRGGPPSGIRRLRADEPCKAITGSANNEFVHPTSNRFLTLRECARIQSFPDSFEFQGNPAQTMKQIGNAVPPIFAYALGWSIVSWLSAPIKSEPSGLKSFLATNSDGMSPALSDLNDRVVARYLGKKVRSQEQMALWP